MRKLVLLVLGMALVIGAPAAAAQEARRDPFRPLVSEDEGGNVPVGTGTTTEEPASQPAPTTGGASAETGMPASDWTAIAYLLIVLGAAAVTLARLRRPITTPIRRR